MPSWAERIAAQIKSAPRRINRALQPETPGETAALVGASSAPGLSEAIDGADFIAGMHDRDLARMGFASAGFLLPLIGGSTLRRIAGKGADAAKGLVPPQAVSSDLRKAQLPEEPFYSRPPEGPMEDWPEDPLMVRTSDGSSYPVKQATGDHQMSNATWDSMSPADRHEYLMGGDSYDPEDFEDLTEMLRDPDKFGMPHLEGLYAEEALDTPGFGMGDVTSGSGPQRPAKTGGVRRGDMVLAYMSLLVPKMLIIGYRVSNLGCMHHQSFPHQTCLPAYIPSKYAAKTL